MSLFSETMRPVGENLDFGSDYQDICLIKETQHGRLFSATRAGKRFLLKAAASDSGKDISMLKREYELTLSLSHPGLAYVFTYEASSPVGPCIVMEFVDGVTLQDFLSQKPSPARRKRVFGQLLDIIEYIHRRGIVHNDLSLSNIMITRSDGSVKLIDFGFSDDDVHYLAHSLGSTRDFASPELLSGRTVDARSDIWSLGRVMEMVFPGRYRRVVRKCTQDEPGRRYSSVAALRKAWKGFYRPVGVMLVAMAAVALGAVVYQFNQDWKTYREVVDAENQRTEMLEAYKGKIDAWYVDNIVPFRRNEYSSPQAKIDSVQSVTERYIAFLKSTLDECPESIRPAVTDYLVFKYNSDFPTEIYK